jgi:hypothetical protein
MTCLVARLGILKSMVAVSCMQTVVVIGAAIALVRMVPHQ